MNRVFESFCRAALESRFGVIVEEQKTVGWLLQEPQSMRQIPDYRWRFEGQWWIGDAKWKLLGEKAANAETVRLSPDDARQLITYSELDYRQRTAPRNGQPQPGRLAIFYPALRKETSVTTYRAWNEAQLDLVPVRISGWSAPGDALPAAFAQAR
jgi:5-methylcytosine-specific restriction endonuclease McrBC regulatory subunit McrC